MVSMETDVEELLALVVSTGRELDEQLVQLSQMGDLVRKGKGHHLVRKLILYMKTPPRPCRYRASG